MSVSDGKICEHLFAYHTFIFLSRKKKGKKTMEEIELGDRVQDRITKQQGIAIGITKWLFGCVRISVQPEEVKDGKPVEAFCIDVAQCTLVKKRALGLDEQIQKENGKCPGGPKPGVRRGQEITNGRGK